MYGVLMLFIGVALREPLARRSQIFGLMAAMGECYEQSLEKGRDCENERNFGPYLMAVNEQKGDSPDVSANFGEVLLHVFLVSCVDDFNDFLHFLSDLLHLSFCVGIEEDFAEEGVIFRKNPFGNLHVSLEGGARCILVLHHRCEGEGGDERDGEGVGNGLIVLLESVFEDVEP